MSESTHDQKMLAIALQKLEALKRNSCFDPYNLDSLPTSKQEAILKDTDSLHRYIVAGNQSGKTQLGARDTVWRFLESHPHWKRSPEWGSEPLLLIVAGRISDQLEEIWLKKMKPFIPPERRKEQRAQKVLKSVEDPTTGNKIIFTSHDKASEAREKVQSYVAHFVWLDEMPSDHKYIEELHRRVDAKQGQFLATFTPKSRNDRIRQMVDNVDVRIGIKYNMNKLDNPIYSGREEIELAKLAGLTQAEINNIMEGAWLDADEKVFPFHRNLHVVDYPVGYSKQWRHVVAVDPAASGKAGFVLAANLPNTNHWFVVEASYIEGDAPSKQVLEVEKKLRGYNIFRRIYDPHEAGYAKEANILGIRYMGVYKKTLRKGELITNLQEILLSQRLTFAPGNEECFLELSGAEWAAGRDDKIKNSQRMHIIDAIQYLVDNLPATSVPYEPLTGDAALIAKAKAQIISEQKAAEQRAANPGRKKFDLRKTRRKKKWML